jgi:hypothetical protein
MALFSARITELEQQLAAVTAERDSFAEANQDFNTRHLADQATIAALTAERDRARAEASANANAAQELATERETREATIAAQVTARLAAAGTDPIARDPGASAANGDILAQLAAITDPREHVLFYRKNKAAIDAAYSR